MGNSTSALVKQIDLEVTQLEWEIRLDTKKLKSTDIEKASAAYEKYLTTKSVLSEQIDSWNDFSDEKKKNVAKIAMENIKVARDDYRDSLKGWLKK